MPSQTRSQATNSDYSPYRFTEDALAEDFARDADGRLLYVPSRNQWFWRLLDGDGAPYWAPDDCLMVWRFIRDYLRRTAAEHPRDYELNRRLGSAATVQAIELLARSDLADDESALEPGRLAKSEEVGALMLAEIRKGRAAPAAPASPPVAEPIQCTPAAPAAPKARRRGK
jgi:hypothetical protein